jgi:thiamine biosynthesis lipoprotein
MGSPLRLTFGHGPGDPREAADLWRAVVDEFELAEAAMSRFRDTSEVTIANRSVGSGIAVRPSRRLRVALVGSDRARRMTGGRFDPRVLDDLDQLGYRGAAVTDEGSPNPTRTRASGRVVEPLGRDGLMIGCPIDLGGIGKGLTLRWAVDRLERAGTGDFLLEAGGDLVARGHDRDGDRWHVGIEDPAGADDLAVVALADRAIATSSIRVNRWLADGRVVHHLLDPRTGRPANTGLIAVTVAGRDPAWAEIWSKALFIGGLATIASEARAHGVAAWWVTDDATFEMTPAARAMTIWVAAENAIGAAGMA